MAKFINYKVVVTSYKSLLSINQELIDSTTCLVIKKTIRSYVQRAASDPRFAGRVLSPSSLSPFPSPMVSKGKSIPMVCCGPPLHRSYLATVRITSVDRGLTRLDFTRRWRPQKDGLWHNSFDLINVATQIHYEQQQPGTASSLAAVDHFLFITQHFIPASHRRSHT